MSRRLLLDTDVLVDHLRGFDKATSLVAAHGADSAISSISVAELFTGVRDDGRVVLEEFLSIFQTIPVTDEIAREAGLLRRTFGPSHGVGLPDAIVAATARAYGMEIRTANVRHFPMFKRLQAAYTKP